MSMHLSFTVSFFILYTTYILILWFDLVCFLCFCILCWSGLLPHILHMFCYNWALLGWIQWIAIFAFMGLFWGFILLLWPIIVILAFYWHHLHLGGVCVVSTFLSGVKVCFLSTVLWGTLRSFSFNPFCQTSTSLLITVLVSFRTGSSLIIFAVIISSFILFMNYSLHSLSVSLYLHSVL